MNFSAYRGVATQRQSVQEQHLDFYDAFAPLSMPPFGQSTPVDIFIGHKNSLRQCEQEIEGNVVVTEV